MKNPQPLRREIRRAKAHQVAVFVVRLMMPRGVGARGDGTLRDDHDEARARDRQERPYFLQGHVGDAEMGKSARERTKDGDAMAGEIQRSLDFYTATAADSHIARLYLSGGTAKIPALFKVIEQRVGVPVEILNPFKGVEIDNRRFDPNYVMDVAPSAAVAIGLALRKSNER